MNNTNKKILPNLDRIFCLCLINTLDAHLFKYITSLDDLQSKYLRPLTAADLPQKPSFASNFFTIHYYLLLSKNPECTNKVIVNSE